jgi:hypothetical protein
MLVTRKTIGYELAMSQVLIEIIRKADRRPIQRGCIVDAATPDS